MFIYLYIDNVLFLILYKSLKYKPMFFLLVSLFHRDGDSSLKAGGIDTTSVDLSLPATGDIGLAQCIPHEQHLIG